MSRSHKSSRIHRNTNIPLESQIQTLNIDPSPKQAASYARAMERAKEREIEDLFRERKIYPGADLTFNSYNVPPTPQMASTPQRPPVPAALPPESNLFPKSREDLEREYTENVNAELNRRILLNLMNLAGGAAVLYHAPEIYRWSKQQLPRAYDWAKEKYSNAKKRITGKTSGKVTRRKVPQNKRKPRGKSCGKTKKNKIIKRKYSKRR